MSNKKKIMEAPSIPFTVEQLEAIREAHIDIIFHAHMDMISDQEAFDKYLTKMTAAHTIATMQLIEKDREQR